MGAEFFDVEYLVDKNRGPVEQAKFFNDKKPAITAEQAFTELVQQAQYDYGHSGYTGTIAEKDSFKMVELPKEKNVYDFIEECLDNEDGFWNDKWGPAACIKEEHRDEIIYHFFGWASS